MKNTLLLTAGKGPKECAFALKGVYEIMLREAQSMGLSFNGDCEQDLPRSILITVEGKNAESFCQAWLGSILWHAQSLFRPNYRRKNWFVEVFEIKRPNTNWRLDEKDVRFESFRAGVSKRASDV